MQSSLKNAHEVAEWLQVTPARVLAWARTGMLSATTLGGRTKRFTDEAIIAFIKEQTPDEQWSRLPEVVSADMLGQLWTIDDVAAHLGLTRQTVYSYMDRGLIGYIMVGGNRRVSAYHLTHFTQGT